jgi:hypothetical protein
VTVPTDARDERLWNEDRPLRFNANIAEPSLSIQSRTRDRWILEIVWENSGRPPTVDERAVREAAIRCDRRKASTTGSKLKIGYGLIADIKKRMIADETADVVPLSRPPMDHLQNQNKFATGISGL